MSGGLFIKNRQRTTSVNTRLLKTIADAVLNDLLRVGNFDLVIYLVRAPEMATLNKKFLQHKGSTDVITFDYAEAVPSGIRYSSFELHGEIFICIDDTLSQARQFQTSWQSELIRYVIHGILHLRGFDDLHAPARRKMKREENRLLKEVARLFPLRKLAANSKLAA